MRVLLLGATGTVGGAVARALAGAGHAVVCPCRDPAAARRRWKGSAITAIPGDLADPDGWADALGAADAAIHCAASWAGDMAALDRGVVERLLAFPGRVIYTGGVWLYGPSGDRIIDEETPFAPPPDFSWMVAGCDRLREAHANAVCLHPALVWDHEHGGMLAPMFAAIREGRQVTIPGPGDQRWPLVHRDDLAEAYLLALHRVPAGESLLAVAEEGERLGDLGAGMVVAPTDAGDPRSWDQRASGARARRLGWSPRRGPAHFAVLAEAAG